VNTLICKARTLGLRKSPEWKETNKKELFRRRSEGQKRAKSSSGRFKKGDHAKQWTLFEIGLLKSAYPVTNNTELTELFRCSTKTLINKTESMGLKKNKTSVRLRQVAAFKRSLRERKAIKNTVEI
jgi:hypothetical protein